MAVNKVIFGGETVIDLTGDTVAADKMLSGIKAHDKAGNAITGTVPTKTSSNLTASGATVTVPAGYYASQASKAVASGSAKTPATTVTKNPSISVSSSGLITASVSGTQSVTPTVSAGYVSSGTAGTITVSGSATKQLTTQAAQTITPGTSNKTIASGRYLTGTQTIKGDANLVAGNIKSGVSIFGVAGTYEGSGGGGSGGGSIETCTVEITASLSNCGIGLYYTTVENGVLVVKELSAPLWPSISITCVCNSIIHVSFMGGTVNGLNTDGIKVIHVYASSYVIHPTVGNGETASIYAIYDAGAGGGSGGS